VVVEKFWIFALRQKDPTEQSRKTLRRTALRWEELES